MPNLDNYLILDRCPHCKIDHPNLTSQGGNFETVNFNNSVRRRWKNYRCVRCGGVVTAGCNVTGGSTITEMYPESTTLDEAIPGRAKDYLSQSIDSIHAPAGSIMLAASSVDAMLKSKDYREGSLYNRIDQAAEDHLITEEMAQWAHQVRLEANEQRHADDNFELPTEQDAQLAIDFTLALAEFLFVLPSKVAKGIEETQETVDPTNTDNIQETNGN